MMAPTIDHIETAGPDRRARRLVLSGEEEPRLTAGPVVKELGLEAGMAFADDELEALLGEAESRHAKERALRLLGYRDRSRHEIDKRLADDGYPRTIRVAVVDRLIELGLVDDERFAATWARSRTVAGFGPRRISVELQQRGIDPDSVALALEALECGDEAQRARAALRGQTASTPKERERLVRRLVSKGFGLQAALAAVGESVQDDEGHI